MKNPLDLFFELCVSQTDEAKILAVQKLEAYLENIRKIL